MKKTLCKAIHEFDRDIFICLEDIISVEISKNVKKSLIITFKSNNLVLDLETHEKCEELHLNIIKELEEYYGVVSKI